MNNEKKEENKRIKQEAEQRKRKLGKKGDKRKAKRT